MMENKLLDQAPRVVLKKIMAEAAKEGLYIKTGVEPEFFLTMPCGTKISDEADTAAKSCYDQQAMMRRYDVISEICDCMLELGWGPYQNDHEDANGQWEMNWNYDGRSSPLIVMRSSSSWPRQSPRNTGCAQRSCPSRSLG